MSEIALQTNMKKVPWFFIGNKNLSVIRADGVFQVRVHIRIHISFPLHNLTQNEQFGTRLSIGHGPSCTKFCLVIPGTECSQTHLFLISANDTKFSYDLIKFYSSQEQD